MELGFLLLCYSARKFEKEIIMFKKIKILSLSMCAALTLQACHDDDHIATADAPKQVLDISASVYERLRAGSPAADGLFTLAGAVAGTGTAAGTEPCQVRLHKMIYDTVGGAGEATKSSGVVMVPYGEHELCSGPRPVMLYAHGTNADSDFDLSKIVADPDNAANNDGVLVLSMYAAQGYIVVAPNYVGYSEDSTLGYHPYLDKVQQSTEMVNALEHFRIHADTIGANTSSKLFVSGLSAGGNVAMATHEALEAKGETVTASLPISGPYAMLDFIDTLVAGYVNAGATLFAPMYFTAAQKRENIYTEASDLYSSSYDMAEGSLPRPGGFEAAVLAGVLPPNALFNIDSMPTPTTPAPALNPVNMNGFGTPFLVSDSFRNAYLVDAATNGDMPQNKLRQALKNDDLRTDWSPSSPVFMCGSESDLTVYHNNSDKMAAHLNSALVTNIELSDTASGTPALIQTQWNNAVQGGATWFANGSPDPQPAGSISPTQVHGQTGAYCSAIALGLFKNM